MTLHKCDHTNTIQTLLLPFKTHTYTPLYRLSTTCNSHTNYKLTPYMHTHVLFIFLLGLYIPCSNFYIKRTCFRFKTAKELQDWDRCYIISCDFLFPFVFLFKQRSGSCVYVYLYMFIMDQNHKDDLKDTSRSDWRNGTRKQEPKPKILFAPNRNLRIKSNRTTKRVTPRSPQVTTITLAITPSYHPFTFMHISSYSFHALFYIQLFGLTVTFFPV